MMTRTRPGAEPLLVLALLLGGWVALRVAFWESPFPQPAVDLPGALLAKTVPLEEPILGEPEGKRATAYAPAAAGPVEKAPSMAVPVQVDRPSPGVAPALPDALRPQPVPFVAPSPVPTAPPITQRLSAAHTMLMMAGLSGASLPPELAKLLEKKNPSDSAPGGAPEVEDKDKSS